ncbi:MAG: glutamate formimidoyltransferase [Deltaproteobacteria bacterium]|nr:glutamate formimidoyltransferase [Deltaproteobacteria bacterium]MBW2596663.1 glutamate formimidoyltransferase [Deltaproteobacteria bacterium]MBW2650499.1 glutamate formimidoyltransferase [Deltaproteobacteria bacterium]
MKIIECIPNFSEGRDKRIVEAIAGSVARIEGVKVLDFSMDSDHNRSVLTFIGSPEATLRGAVAACDMAAGLIDMRRHSGVHPRIGAVDVVPFVPLVDANMSDAVATARRFGHIFGKKNNVPVYFYGEATLEPEKKKLADIRRGQYEGLRDKMNDPAWAPDISPDGSGFNPRLGATTVGARKPLIAFNINLNSNDIELARDIARSIRHSSGGFKHVQALGVLLESKNIAQVSMNLADYEVTSIRTVFDAVRKKADEHGVDILESELIGLIPRAALEEVTADYLKLLDFSEKRIIESHC